MGALAESVAERIIRVVAKWAWGALRWYVFGA